MAKLDWEKANKRVVSVPFFDKSWETEVSDTDIKNIPLSEAKKLSKTAEPVNEEEYKQDMQRHAKKRAYQKQYRANKKAEAIKRKEEQRNKNRSFESGKQQERERIIKLLETYYKPEDTKTICFINHEQYLDLIDLIKGEQK